MLGAYVSKHFSYYFLAKLLFNFGLNYYTKAMLIHILHFKTKPLPLKGERLQNILLISRQMPDLLQQNL
jgi:hypothetical protein